jgi:hypothetical protein
MLSWLYHLRAREYPTRDELGRDMSRRTTPRSYYQHFVKPNFQDYLQSPDDVRLGFNASLTAFQLAEVMYWFYKRNNPGVVSSWNALRDFHSHLSGREPLFRTIQSVASVYKHLHLYKLSHYEIGSPGALSGLKLANAGFEANADWSEDGTGDVMVKRRNGTVASLTQALKAVVLSLWPSVLPPESAT